MSEESTETYSETGYCADCGAYADLNMDNRCRPCVRWETWDLDAS